MGRAPCCDKANVKRGPWSPEEDSTLKNYVDKYGTGGNWIALPQKAGLKRCGKSCRLRWLNYLRPNIKHGGFTEEEDNIICSLYKSIGSRWSVIASRLPGRTDNDVKNYWNTKLKKKLMTAGATSLTTTAHINITPAGEHRIRHSSASPSPSPPVPVTPIVKTENYSYHIGNFYMSNDSMSCSTVNPSNAGFDHYAQNSFRVVPSPIEPSSTDFANAYVVSPPQTISAASSSLTTENNNGNSYVSWPANSGGENNDPFFMDFGFGLMDFIGSSDSGGYGVQDKIGDFAPNISADHLVNLWATAETKAQGLHQSVMYS